MIARLALATLILALCACQSTIPVGSDGVGEGDANYDALRKATEACQAHGGVLTPRTGYDIRRLSGFECKPAKAS